MKYDLLTDVKGDADCGSGHGHETDRNTKRVWGRWGPLLLPAHPPIIISLVSPLLSSKARTLALHNHCVGSINCWPGQYTHIEMECTTVFYSKQRWVGLSCVTDAIRSLSPATIRNHKRAEHCCAHYARDLFVKTQSSNVLTFWNMPEPNI